MRALLLSSLLAAASFGCGSKTEPTPAASANPPAGEPAKAGGGGSTADHRAADDKATEVEQAKGAAQANATTAKAVLDDDATKVHKETRDRLQASFDASDRRFNALKEKAAKATGANQAGVDQAILEISAREGTVMAGIGELRDASGPTWESTRAKVDADAKALNEKIDALETSLR